MPYLTDAELRPIYTAWVDAGRPDEPATLVPMLKSYERFVTLARAKSARDAMSADERRLADREAFRARRGGEQTDTPCDAKCRMAMHDSCQCSCAGENHGVDFDALAADQMEHAR